jgi:2,4-dienoyl-CoA reductase-like NADH-dependent reductase (Old Yellow Enzyme family)/thioredoxin reductase
MFRYLFQPLRLRSLTLRNRIICGAMEKNLCTEDGLATERYADYVEERARGGAGLIIPESAYVARSGRARKLQMGVHDDSVLPGLRRLVDRAHRHGAAVGMQLHHGGRTCQEAISGIRPIAPSPVPCKVLGGADVPREMTRAEIRETVGQFRRAAIRCVQAGCDLVEVHAAHGYLVEQFLSPFSNKRDDEYGGTSANRCRFPLEVIRAVREAVGPNFPIACRISADEFVDGGLTLEDTLRFAKILEEEGIDLLEVSAGIYESGHMIVQPMQFPLSGYAGLARRFKAETRIPVSVAGRIVDPVQAENLLAEGSADIVTIVRGFHADPYFPRKALDGRMEDICTCLTCNLGCADKLRENVPLSCILNTASGYERECRLRPALKKKTVWIAGGGPAGLMAARLSGLRGHSVTLFEGAREAGGMVRYACRPEHKTDFAQVIRFLAREAHRAGAQVRLGHVLEAGEIRSGRPDVLIFATGSLPALASIPGWEDAKVRTVTDALDRPHDFGEGVVVYGGQMIGGETALYLAEKGRRVTLVEPGNELVSDLGARSKWYLMKGLGSHPNLSVFLNTRIIRGESGRLIARRGDEALDLGAPDFVIGALERVPNRLLLEEAEKEKLAGEIYAVGDCVVPARITEATREATRVALTI